MEEHLNWRIETSDNSMKIQLDLTRGKIVRVDNTTSYDFADIEKLEDGFWYYRPESGRVFQAWVLRVIADLLDEANREWKKQLNKTL